MATVKHLPQQSERMETGVVQFGDDWPGVFIRGDNALHFAFVLSLVLNNETVEEKIDWIRIVTLKNLAETLAACDVRSIGEGHDNS